mmetsp:Transcript_22828/g.54071  ORF Transcript_22828/g.54071 Transcript_22828/m.54071 type:complete len:321 (+) Transcript_22828:284-1246(+)
MRRVDVELPGPHGTEPGTRRPPPIGVGHPLRSVRQAGRSGGGPRGGGRETRERLFAAEKRRRRRGRDRGERPRVLSRTDPDGGLSPREGRREHPSGFSTTPRGRRRRGDRPRPRADGHGLRPVGPRGSAIGLTDQPEGDPRRSGAGSIVDVVVARRSARDGVPDGLPVRPASRISFGFLRGREERPRRSDTRSGLGSTDARRGDGRDRRFLLRSRRKRRRRGRRLDAPSGRRRRCRCRRRRRDPVEAVSFFGPPPRGSDSEGERRRMKMKPGFAGGGKSREQRRSFLFVFRLFRRTDRPAAWVRRSEGAGENGGRRRSFG